VEWALHRRKSIDINDAGVTVSDSLSEHRETWASFIRWRESPNLFALYTSKFTWIMLPKRCVNDEDVAKLREILQTHIHEPVGAFPVAVKIGS
jgi:hypothetical protein